MIRDRRLTAISIGLGSGAADMSGWLMMALPGFIFSYGMKEIWYPLGLFIGAFLNWIFVAKKLRIETTKLYQSSTISSYFSSKFSDKKRHISTTVSICTTFFYVIYITSSLTALALLIEATLNFHYNAALIISCIFVFTYVTVGGFLGINWIDVMQAGLMLTVLILVPIFTIYFETHNITNQIKQIDILYWNICDISPVTAIFLLSWGLGYFGQPHILDRFIAIDAIQHIKTSAIICLTWMLLSLFSAIAIGVLGRLLFSRQDIYNNEMILLEISKMIFNPWILGVVLSSIVASILSTIAAQLHTCSTILTDYIVSNRSDALIKYRFFVFKCAMVFFLIISSSLAYYSNSSILKLVSFAWAGLGSSLGPILILSLYVKNISKDTALYSMLYGSIFVILIYITAFWFRISDVYIMLPSFMTTSIFILIRRWLKI